MSKVYGLICVCDNTLTEGVWVLDNDLKVVTYPSAAAAMRDVKKNFVSSNYEAREYKNDVSPRSRSKRRK